MNIGAFSLSLSVQDLEKSKSFYEALGFEVVGGDADQNWLILRNGSGGTTIGLFEGMFPKNMLTFNPGWSADAEPLPDFTDIRDIQDRLKIAEIPLGSEIDSESEGPGSLMIEDPDGNPILIDQHVPKPVKNP